MRTQRSIHRRAAKRNAQRKDYERRRNINANVPTEKVEMQREIFRPVRDKRGSFISKNGRPNLEHVGYRTVIRKQKRYLHRDKRNPSLPRVDEFNREVGMISYPPRRKYQSTKK